VEQALAIVNDYLHDIAVDLIVERHNITRTDLAYVVTTSGVRRAAETSLTNTEAARLYSMLHAAQAEIGTLRQRILELEQGQ